MQPKQTPDRSAATPSNTLRDIACLATVFAGLTLPALGIATERGAANDNRPLVAAKNPLPPRVATKEELKTAPNFELKDLDGATVALKSLLEKNPEKVVLLKFGASWCGPCRASTPQLNELQEKYGKKLTVVDVNQRESRETAAKYAKDHGVKYTTVLDSDGAVGGKYDVSGIPDFALVKLVDGTPTIVLRQVGYQNSVEFKKAFHDAIVAQFVADKKK